MNDGRRRKGVAGMRVYPGEWHVGDQRHHDELQSDQSAGSRADDYVEVRPSAECCHAVDQPPSLLAPPNAQYSMRMIAICRMGRIRGISVAKWEYHVTRLLQNA